MFFTVFHIRDHYEARAAITTSGLLRCIRKDDPLADMVFVQQGSKKWVMRAVERFNDLRHETRYDLASDPYAVLEWLATVPT